MPDHHFWRDSSNRLTFEMFQIPIESYPAVCTAVVAAFQLSPDTELVTNGCDIVFQDYRRGEQLIGFAWDNWTGFTVFAKTINSESLLREIATWLLRSAWANEA